MILISVFPTFPRHPELYAFSVLGGMQEMRQKFIGLIDNVCLIRLEERFFRFEVQEYNSQPSLGFFVWLF